MKFKIRYTRIIENSYTSIIEAKSKADAISIFFEDTSNIYSTKTPEKINVAEIKLTFIEQII
jgi:hypothetical protein